MDYPTVSFIIPTIGRESLKRTLASIETWEGDQVLAIQHTPPSGGYGGPERNEGMAKATCDYLAFIDDDDWYVAGHRVIMDIAARENVDKRPILFRMQYPSGRLLWDTPHLRNGNLGSPMIFVPNIKERLPQWGTNRSADFQFINCLGPGWEERKLLWRSEIIAYVGHEDDEYIRRTGRRHADQLCNSLP